MVLIHLLDAKLPQTFNLWKTIYWNRIKWSTLKWGVPVGVSLGQDFSSSALLFGIGSLFVGGGNCSGHCRMFGNIPGLHPIRCQRHSPLSLCEPKISLHITKCPLRGKIALSLEPLQQGRVVIMNFADQIFQNIYHLNTCTNYTCWMQLYVLNVPIIRAFCGWMRYITSQDYELWEK